MLSNNLIKLFKAGNPFLIILCLSVFNICSNSSAILPPCLPDSAHLSQSVLHLCLPIIYPIDPSILKAGQSFLAFRRYKLGADSALFSQEYTDPSQDAAGAPYTSFGGDDLDSPEERGGQANSDRAFDGTGGYQRQDF